MEPAPLARGHIHMCNPGVARIGAAVALDTETDTPADGGRRAAGPEG